MQIPEKRPCHPAKTYFRWLQLKLEAERQLKKDKAHTFFWSHKINEAEEKMIVALCQIDADVDFEP